MSERVCKDCAFYVRFDDTRGLCHRYPPAITRSDDQTTVSNFAPTAALEWCGEFKRKRRFGIV